MMHLTKKLLKKISNGKYNDSYLDLSDQYLTDEQLLPLIDALILNSNITSLNLRKNKLTKKTWQKLAFNTTIKEIALTGNEAIKVKDLQPFESNKTLTKIVGARGKKLKAQLEKNAEPIIKKVNVSRLLKQEQLDLKDISDGEASFQQLIHSFIFDLESFDSDIDYIIWYSAVALNFYMHNASHAPINEFSSVQAREFLAKLYYSRSQDKHPAARRNDAFIKPFVAEKQKLELNKLRNRGVGALNPALTNLFNTSINDNNHAAGSKSKKLLTNLNNIHPKHGFPKKHKTIKDYFSLALAHGGMRSNNITATKNILKYRLKNDATPNLSLQNILQEKASIKQLNEPTQKIKKFTPKVLNKLIVAYHKKFQSLQQKNKDKPFLNLQKQVLDFKKTKNSYLTQHFNQWSEDKINPLKIYEHGDGCLIIEINPLHLMLDANINETGKQKITELLIGFLGGLINHQIAINDLSLWVERRQSFGFNLSTLTDVGTLKIRLSHGLEPKIFQTILLKSLKLFYKAIKQDEEFNLNLTKTRSEDKQWRAPFEAQYHLQTAKKNNRTKYVNTAFNAYIQTFGVEDEKNIIEPQNCQENFTSYKKTQPQPDNYFDETPIFAILQNTLKQAIALATKLNIDEIKNSLKFKQSYFHCQGKLYLHCTNAKGLLKKVSSKTIAIEISQAFKDANKLLENIMEYMIVLDNLHAIQAKELETYIDPTIKLVKTEKQYVKQSFNVSKKNIDIYFTDSGQQAIVTTLLALDLELLLSNKQNSRLDSNFYNFDNSYFEVTSFLNDIGWQHVTKSNASLTFIDIINLKKFKFKDFSNLKYLVIDVTHQPLFTDQLKKVISIAQKKSISIALVSSCLKHDELGLDKYTAGKITLINPPKTTLHNEVTMLIESISKSGNNYAVPSYLQLINHINGDKIPIKPITAKESLIVSGAIASTSRQSYQGTFFTSQHNKTEPVTLTTKAPTTI